MNSSLPRCIIYFLPDPWWRAKGKCPSSTHRVFKAKFQTEPPSKPGLLNPAPGALWGPSLQRLWEAPGKHSCCGQGTVPWTYPLLLTFLLGWRWVEERTAGRGVWCLNPCSFPTQSDSKQVSLFAQMFSLLPKGKENKACLLSSSLPVTPRNSLADRGC